jgi:hypothetical protein
MQAFQEAMERGEAEHLMPVMNAAERIKKGELKPEDIPYMQRGGVSRMLLRLISLFEQVLFHWDQPFRLSLQSWDNSDIRGAKKKKWSARDKEYSRGGFLKEQSVSIFGKGEGLDWTGTRSRSGPESMPAAAPKFAKNYKAPNVYNMKGIGNDKKEEPKKKLFGLF